MRHVLVIGLTLGLLVALWMILGFHDVRAAKTDAVKAVAVWGVIGCLAGAGGAAVARAAKRGHKRLFSPISFSARPDRPQTGHTDWPLFEVLASSLSPHNRVAAVDLMYGATGREVLAIYKDDWSYQRAQAFVGRLADSTVGMRVAAFACPPVGGIVYVRGTFGEGALATILTTLKEGCYEVMVG